MNETAINWTDLTWNGTPAFPPSVARVFNRLDADLDLSSSTPCDDC
jgi:hypothetical protein